MQADQVGCTLLMRVDNELRDVAAATIVAPVQRVMNNLPLAPDAFRVHIDRVLSGCKDLYPPSQPAGADSELTLRGCLGYPMTWPKALIRLDGPITCTPPQPTLVGSANQEQPVPNIAGDDDDHNDIVIPSMSQIPVVSDDDHNDFMDHGSDDERVQDHDLQAPLPSSKRRLFNSQGTPEAAPSPRINKAMSLSARRHSSRRSC